MNAVIPLELILTGSIFSYVSSSESMVFIDFSFLYITFLTRLGRSLYASGPATISTIFSSFSNLSFNLSAIHPSIPTTIDGLFFL